MSDLDERDPQFVAVLESAAHLQRLVPGAVLVGGTAAILYADHRESRDHDHVLADLADRFEMVLEAVEGDEGWATNRVTPGKVILGNLDGIEAGVRQMIRKIPLEVATVALPSGGKVTAPTIEETLRIKAFLIVRRNQTRDYLDLAALSGTSGSIEPPRFWQGSTTTTPTSRRKARASRPSWCGSSPIHSPPTDRSSISSPATAAYASAGAIGTRSRRSSVPSRRG